MSVNLLMRFLFWFIVIFALFIDLVILKKHKNNTKLKNAVATVCAWIGIALLFGLIIYLALGKEQALEYITGYVIEYSLSIDNMFVSLMIFTYFNILKDNQPKVLIYGITGAVLLRFLFVFAGVHLINTFSWIIYIFGAILIYTAAKMLLRKDRKVALENNIAYKALKHLLPFKLNVATNKFFVRENAILYAAPMLATVVVRDTFIVYTSNFLQS